MVRRKIDDFIACFIPSDKLSDNRQKVAENAKESLTGAYKTHERS